MSADENRAGTGNGIPIHRDAAQRNDCASEATYRRLQLECLSIEMPGQNTTLSEEQKGESRMSRTRHLVAGIFTATIVGFAAPSAASRPTTEYYFYGCVGDGPAAFSAVKTLTPPQSGLGPSAGAAYQRTDGRGTYQIVSFGDGNFDPPGIRGASSGYNLVCQIDFLIGTTTVYGYFAAT